MREKAPQGSRDPTYTDRQDPMRDTEEDMTVLPTSVQEARHAVRTLRPLMVRLRSPERDL